MKKEVIGWLIQLMIVAALGFVGWELHRLNGQVRSLDVSVSGSIRAERPVEVETTYPLNVRVER